MFRACKRERDEWLLTVDFRLSATLPHCMISVKPAYTIAKMGRGYCVLGFGCYFRAVGRTRPFDYRLLTFDYIVIILQQLLGKHLAYFLRPGTREMDHIFAGKSLVTPTEHTASTAHQPEQRVVRTTLLRYHGCQRLIQIWQHRIRHLLALHRGDHIRRTDEQQRRLARCRHQVADLLAH